MEGAHENDEFVSAADFFRQQQAPAAGTKAEDAVVRRPPRESLLVVARNSQVKTKISAFDRPGGPVAGMALTAFGKPTAPAASKGGSGNTSSGHVRPPVPRRVGAAPALGAIAEEAVGAVPQRRHAAVVSTATAAMAAAPPRRHAAAAMATAPAPAAAAPQPVLPSPGTKQQVAEKRHEARFPSIMFQPPASAAQKARAPLPSGSMQPPPVAAAAHAERSVPEPRPVPSMLTPAHSEQPLQPIEQLPRSEPGQQAEEAAERQQQQPVLPQALAAVLAAEAAAVVRVGAESEDEEGHFVDADSGGGSGGLSLEGSAVWADAADAHSPHPNRQGSTFASEVQPQHPVGPHAGPHFVIHEEDDAASVASDASTVVHDHSDGQLGAAEQGELAEDWPHRHSPEVAEQQLSGLDMQEEAAAPTGQEASELAAAGELAAEPAELPDAVIDHDDPAPPAPRESLLLAAAELDAVQQTAAEADPEVQLPVPFGSAAGELFQSASKQLPAFEAAASYRASLSPAVSAASQRRSSLIGAPQQLEAAAAAVQEAVQEAEASVRVSLSGGMRAVVAPADALAGGGSELEAQQQEEQPAQQQSAVAAAEAPALPSSAFAATCPAQQRAEEPSDPPVPGSETSAASVGGAGSALPAMQPEASRLSGASSTAAPSLHIEFSEASLRYSVDHLPHSPTRSHASQDLSAAAAQPELPSAAAVTPQQRRLSGLRSAASPPAVPANTPASPAQYSSAAAAAAVAALQAAEAQRSRPVAASAVAHAIEQAAAEEADERRASLASEQNFSGSAEPGPAAPVADASPAAAGSPAQAASPVPPTPYAATEYDGDDVVMMDIDSTPGPTTGRRPPPRTSRFALEALASASAAHQLSASALETADGSAGAAAETAAAAAETEVQQALGAAVDAVAAAVEETQAAEQAGSMGAALEVSGEAAAAVVQEAPAPANLQPTSEPQHEAAAQEHQQPGQLKAESSAAEHDASMPAGDGMASPAMDNGIAAVQALPAEQPAVEAPSSSPIRTTEASLPELAPAEAATRRSRVGRLSMPAGPPAAADKHGSRRSRLSLPSGMPWAASEDALAFAPRPKLAATPPAASSEHERQQDDEEAEQQQQEQQPAAEQQQEAVAAEEPDQGDVQGGAEAEPAPFVIRSRLVAEDEEMPGEPAAAMAAQSEEEPAAADVEPAVVDVAEPAPSAVEPAPAEDEQLSAAPAAELAALEAAPQPAPAQQQAAEDDEAAAAFAAKPKLAMSPAVSSCSQGGLGAPPASQQQAEQDGAAAFASKPRLSMSPAVSSGSQGRISTGGSPAEGRPGKPDVTYAAAAAAASLLARQQQVQGEALTAASPALSTRREQEGESQPLPQQVQQAQQQPWMQDSPTMSSNPLAGAGNTPGAGSRRYSHSPAPSGLSAGALSNNPMFAGTPSHPTPPSVNLKSFTGRASGIAGTPQSAASGGSTPASTGMKLAEKLHQVAEQLQNPAAPQGLAALATPGGARLSAGGSMAKTPGNGRFEFADDVQAIFQALDARTPATALGQQPALGRAAAAGAAAATTVQRPQGSRLPRYSFANAGAGLLDLDSYDVHGNRSGQAGPTPLLRQQLLGSTPAVAAALSAGGAPRSAGTSAATPLEVKALRDEVAALRLQVTELSGQREEMVGLLGGYQSSIRELQDKHSVLVVRLQGENAALRAETDELRRVHGGVDEQFRTLYNDKYVPLKAEAVGLRQELAVLQKRVVSEELKAHKAASDAQAARQELAAAQQHTQDYKAALVEAQAEVAAAREAEQRLQQQLAGEQRRVEKALAGKEAELGEVRAKYGALTKQYDEAVHRINLAKQARERAQVEAHRKEEEVVALEVRLKEYEGALREYKKENGKFFEMKERYKAAIAALEKEVQGKEKEKQELLGMCNELMTRLEREGLAV